MTLDPDPLYVPELEAPPARRSWSGWVPVLIVLAVTAAAIAWRLYR